MKIHIRKCDGWIAVYVNGEIYSQGHSLGFTDALDMLIDELKLQVEITSEYLEGDVDFPNILEK